MREPSLYSTVAFDFPDVLILFPANNSIPSLPRRPFGDLSVTTSTPPSICKSVAMAGLLS